MKLKVEIKLGKGQITSKETVIKILDKASDFYFIPSLHSCSGKTVSS